jgi:tetratricopeptide (TPR) repeat protein/sugar lactone lactonase YvrE
MKKNLLCLCVFLAMALPAFAQQYKYVTTIPSADSPMQGPSSAALAADKTYYVADPLTAAVYGFDATGKLVSTIKDVSVSGQSVQLQKPISVCVDGQGNLYILDEKLGSVLVKKKNDQNFSVGKSGDVDAASRVAVDANGYIYVLSSGTKRVEVFSPKGHYLTWLGGFQKPAGIGTTSANEIYVLEKDGPAVHIFDAYGNSVASLTALGTQAGAAVTDAGDLAVLQNGDFLILDKAAGKVLRFGRDGKLIDFIGSSGTAAKGVFQKAEAIAVSGSGDALLVVDAAAKTLQHFQIPARTGSVALGTTLRKIGAGTADAKIEPFLDFAVAANNVQYAIPASNPKLVSIYKNSVKSGSLNAAAAAALATDPSGNVYVADKGTAEILTFDTDGVLIRKLGKDVTPPLKEPTGVAVSRDGHLFVADRADSTIRVWNAQGVFQKIFANASNGVASFKIKADSRGNVYAWDVKANRIVRFNAQGKLDITTLTLRGTDALHAQGEIGGFDVDVSDRLHVFNKTTNQYELFTWHGSPVNIFRYGRSGSGPDAFENVTAIGFDPMMSLGYVVTQNGSAIKAFQFLIKPAKPADNYTFAVENEKLVVLPATGTTAMSYGLVKILEGPVGQAAIDSLVATSDQPSLTLPEDKSDPPVLASYALVTRNATDMSEPSKPFDDYFSYGNRLYTLQRYDEALSAYVTGVDKMGRPTSMRMFVGNRYAALGKTLVGRNDLTRGLFYLKQAAAVYPENKSTLELLGQSYLAYFKKLAADGNYDELLTQASQVKIEDGSLFTYAVTAFDSVSKILIASDNEQRIRTGIGIYQTLLATDGQNSNLLTSVAEGQQQYLDFKKTAGLSSLEVATTLADFEASADKACKAITQPSPLYHKARLLYADALLQSQKADSSAKLCVTEVSKNDASLTKGVIIGYRKILAAAYTAQQKFDPAVTEYQRIVDLTPSDKTNKLALADALVLAQKYDDAKRIYQDLFTAYPEPAFLIGKVGEVELLKKNYNEASFQLEKALKTDPNQRSLYGLLAEAFVGANKYQQSITNYKTAIQYEQQQLAIVKSRSSMMSKAALDIQNRLVKYNLGLGGVYTQVGKSDEAVKAYQEAVSLDATNADAWSGLGTANLNAGLVYEARKAFEKAQQLRPNDEKVSNALASTKALVEKISKDRPPVEIIAVNIDPLFPSLYRNYSDVSVQAIGQAILANNTTLPIGGLTMTLSIDKLTKKPTAQTASTLIGQANTSVPLSALFDDGILNTTEDKTMQATLSVKYQLDGKPREAKKTVTFVLHGRDAITWSDKRRMAAFVSPANDVLVNYVKKLFVTFKDAPTLGMNKIILQAAQIYTTIHKTGVVYSVPQISFAQRTTQAETIDLLQFPMETLKRKSGDCADFVATYCNLLECAGITTAYVDVPGHVFMAFDSQIEPSEIKAAGLEDSDVIVKYGKVWVPIETTLLGTQTFLVAWKSAAEHYYKELGDGHFPELVTFGDARKVYTPATYKVKAFTPSLPKEKELLPDYAKEVAGFFAKTTKRVQDELEQREIAEPENLYVKNKLAVLYAKTGNADKAEEIYQKALALSPESATLHNNLGNIYFQKGDYKKALAEYNKGLETETADGELYINVCKAQLALKNKAEAKKSYAAAIKIKPDLADLYDTLKSDLR